MEVIPSWFKYPHILTVVYLIILPYFIYSILHHVFIGGVKHSKNKRVHLKFRAITKYWLLASVLLSYSYLLVTTTQSIFMFINLSSSSSLIYASICPILSSYRMFSYVSGRSLFYLYFIYRTNDIFNGTYLEYKPQSKYTLTSYITLVILILVIPTSYIYNTMQTFYIQNDNTNNGSYCAFIDNPDSRASDYVRYIFMFGTANDTTYSVVTIFMMVSRLFLLLTDNERKKSNTQKYEYGSSDHIDDGVDIEPDKNDEPTSLRIQSTSAAAGTSPVPGPVLELTQVQSLSQPNHDHVIDTSRELVSQLSVQSIDNDNDNDNTSSPPTPRRGHVPRLSKRITVSKLDALRFHSKTHTHNKLLLLMSKFFIILMCVVISSQLTLLLFLVQRDMVLILFSTDTFVNIICVWLSFSFTDDYYNKYFCGKCCTPFCFPIIKSITLTCNEYENYYQQTHDMNKCCSTKCGIYCKCCCFSSCRYCCSNNAHSKVPKEIYLLARHEIELMITMKEEEEKSKSREKSKTKSFVE